MVTPKDGMTFEFLFSLAAFAVLIVNVVVMIKNNSKSDAKGVVKANLKLDALCRDSSETRLDLKSMKSDIEKMTKKQIEHDFRLEKIEEDLDSACGRIARLEEKEG
jgi:peptidoglycan hydrolase CwlO-like protein